jgi:hypothetical protein
MTHSLILEKIIGKMIFLPHFMPLYLRSNEREKLMSYFIRKMYWWKKCKHDVNLAFVLSILLIVMILHRLTSL